MAPRVKQVMQQARARVFGGDTHVAEKLVSIFEPGTEIICKGKASKPTEFGKMVKIQEAENQIVTSYEVYEKWPSDSALLIPAIASHEEHWDVYRAWPRAMPASTPPATKRRRTKRESSASAFPIATQRAPAEA